MNKPNKGASPAPDKKQWAAQRLRILDQRLGVGVGAKRERERLNKIINP